MNLMLGRITQWVGGKFRAPGIGLNHHFQDPARKTSLRRIAATGIQSLGMLITMGKLDYGTGMDFHNHFTPAALPAASIAARPSSLRSVR